MVILAELGVNLEEIFMYVLFFPGVLFCPLLRRVLSWTLTV
jgi:hypothetical protein